MIFRRMLRLILFLYVFFSAPVVLAQQVPFDARSGSVEKSVILSRPEMMAPQMNNVPGQLDQPQSDLVREQDREILVGSFEFSGNTVFTSHELARLLQQYILTPLRFDELKEALTLIDAHYRKKGFFLARAVLPAQEFNKWIVRVMVLEGRLGEVIVQDNGEHDADMIKREFACAVNGIINEHKILKSLGALNRLPGLNVKAVMRKGARQGTADIVLDVSGRPEGEAAVELSGLIADAEKVELDGGIELASADHLFLPPASHAFLIPAREKDGLQRLDYPKSGLVMEEGRQIEVGSFEFEGNTVFSAHELASLVEPYILKPLHLKELQEVLGVINAAYKKKGFFLARAVLPSQDLDKWVVRVLVVEGRLGEVVVEGNKSYKTDFIKEHFSCAVNGIVNYHRLYKGLLVLNEYPNLFVRAVMRKGKLPGTADVVLKVEEKDPTHFIADANNFGSRNVSRNYGGLAMEHSNLAVGGDKVELHGVMGAPSRSLAYGKVGYSLPINEEGTRLGVSYEQLGFNVQKEYRSIDAKGESRTVGFELAHPYHRSLSARSDLLLGFDIKSSEDYLLGELNSRDELRILRAGFSGDRVDTRFNGRDFMKVELSQGIPDILGGSGKNDPRASRIGGGGNFLKANVELARYQKVALNSVLTTRAMAQLTNDILPVSEQFSIGGANTVRGFSESAHLGDYGMVVSAEFNAPIAFLDERKLPLFRKYLREVLRVVGFVDYGTSYLNNPQVGEDRDYDILGGGFGFRFDFGHDLNAKLDFGFPLMGKDDTTDDGPETYFQIFKKF